jgi:hypothetical protein
MSRRKPSSESSAKADPLANASSSKASTRTKNQPDFEWSKTSRNVASGLILFSLVVVLLGPLSNPIASPHFSAPLATAVSPIHQGMFLDHGYRFFGPDPGPTHRLLFRGVKTDGSEFEGHFPSRDHNWPRLLYHRWFMLSETLFSEQVFKPSESQFKQLQQEYDRQIEILRTEGKTELLEQLKNERELETAFYNSSSKRVDLLVKAVANELKHRHAAKSIELFVQERKIPYPEEVSDGLSLDDPSLLTTAIKICEFDEAGFRSSPKIEALPDHEDSQ